MMHKDIAKNIAKTILDGLKDAQMQCEYAEKAMEEGDRELAMLHKQEADVRLKGVQAWYQHAKKMGLITEDMHPAESVLIDHHKGWYKAMREKIDSMG